jgi:hypothetical protein
MRRFTTAVECHIGSGCSVVVDTKCIPAEVAIPWFDDRNDCACRDGSIHARAAHGQYMQGCRDGERLACSNPSPSCDDNATVSLHVLLC